MRKPMLPFGNSSCIGGRFGNAHVFCFCCSVSALCVLHLIYCCLSRSLKWQLASMSLISGVSGCVPPCPRFIMGGDTHSLCVACLVVEHARSALEGADCPYCVSMRTPRSFQFGSRFYLEDHKWIWQNVWRWARPFRGAPGRSPLGK